MNQPNSAMTRVTHAIKAPATQKFILESVPTTMRKYLTPERMEKVALNCISKNPGLLNCSPQSLVRSICEAASLGLEPTGGVLGHGYLVPYGKECQFLVSYAGLVELARRSGEFQHLEANCVFANDSLTLRYGFNADFSHEPCLRGDRGEMIGAYCLALFKNGERIVTWMSKEDIDKRRKLSRGSVWTQWYEEMAIKTVIKRAAKLWPKTPEVCRALEMEVETAPAISPAPMEAQLAPSSKAELFRQSIQGPSGPATTLPAAAETDAEEFLADEEDSEYQEQLREMQKDSDAREGKSD